MKTDSLRLIDKVKRAKFAAAPTGSFITRKLLNYHMSIKTTAMGEVHNGEGVFGPRRALVIAGSESQVMSLWSVEDLSSRGGRGLELDFFGIGLLTKLMGGAG